MKNKKNIINIIIIIIILLCFLYYLNKKKEYFTINLINPDDVSENIDNTLISIDDTLDDISAGLVQWEYDLTNVV